VVFFLGAMATLNDTLDLTSVEDAYDFILKSGQAIVVPVYKGMYQHGATPSFRGGANPHFSAIT
jgi:hypothetical protein